MARKNLSITLDPEVYEVIKDMAEKDRRTISSMIGLMLKRYMREHPAALDTTGYPEGYSQYMVAPEKIEI